MRIQDLEKQTGLERATIRYYEREGLIKPTRTENGYRDYSPEDTQQLMKIKLLRQLGMSIEKIAKLQQGSADLSAMVQDQSQILSDRIRDNQRARAVCIALARDGAEYGSLDAQHYLTLFQEIQTEGENLAGGPFREEASQEIHPVRRFVARMLDINLYSALVQFVMYVILRIRPLPQDVLEMVILYVSALLYLPLEALLISRFCTTPGKWIIGIRIESAEGGKLDYFYALCRSWEVFRYGLGFQLPIWSAICAIKSYCQLTGRTLRPLPRYDEMEQPSQMEWDRDCELFYSKWEGKRYAKVISCILLIFVISAVTVLDCLRPRFRGDDLTIAEFAANYNAYQTLVDQNVFDEEKLDSDGTWKTEEGFRLIIDMTGQPMDKSATFQYITEDGYIRSVSYENSWENLLMMSPMQGKCLNATMSAASAQDWFNLITMREFLEMYTKATMEPQGTFRYENIEVKWTMNLINCKLTESGMLIQPSDGTYSAIDLQFELVIHQE